MELWYQGKQECSPEMIALAEQWGVECIDAEVLMTPQERQVLNGWGLKPYAIAHCSFQEVLYLDADNVPVCSPEYLFDSPEYKAVGAVFWPDRGSTGAENAIWEICDVPYKREPEFESGQLLVDKERHWPALMLTIYMNRRRDLYYRVLHGDKDTFRFAWHKLKHAFAMTPYPLKELAVPGCGPWGTMCQCDFEGQLIFQHRSFPKWTVDGVNIRVAGFIHEAKCMAFLSELNAAWQNCPIRSSLHISVTDMRGALDIVAKALISTAYIIENDPPRPHLRWNEVRAKDAVEREQQEKTYILQEIKFERNGRITWGNSHGMAHWKITQDKHGCLLNLCDFQHVVGTLRRSEKDSWQGSIMKNGYEVGIRISPTSTRFPGSRHVEKMKDVAETQVKAEVRRELHVCNSAPGLGDAVVAVYAACGLASANYEVYYYSQYAAWFAGVQHPHLTIYAQPAPENAVDFNYEYDAQLKFAKSKAYWYICAIDTTARPTRPQVVARHCSAQPMDIKEYVVVCPFAAWNVREWPAVHWVRLAAMLYERGLTVVALGAAAEAAKLAATFAHTNVFWAVDQSPEMVRNILLGAVAVVGNDSGLTHFAGLLGVPTLAIHAHLPSGFLWDCTSVMHVAPATQCTFCRWESQNGYTEACDVACSALHSLAVEKVLEEVVKLCDRSSGNAGGLGISATTGGSASNEAIYNTL